MGKIVQGARAEAKVDAGSHEESRWFTAKVLTRKFDEWGTRIDLILQENGVIQVWSMGGTVKCIPGF
jgi:hypothetical protein